jgi:hypothetical protein
LLNGPELTNIRPSFIGSSHLVAGIGRFDI